MQSVPNISHFSKHGSARTFNNAPARTIIDGHTLHFHAERIIGNGSFGVVFQASVIETGAKDVSYDVADLFTGEVVAIKKVLQDKRFKNRELQIMRRLAKDPHPNIIALKYCFYSSEAQSGGSKSGDSILPGRDRRRLDCLDSDTPCSNFDRNLYLNLVLEYMPETVYSVARRWQKAKVSLPIAHTCLYVHQVCRALGQIHAAGICHRDIKPQNLLLNPETQQVKLIDFGSAKYLVPGEPNVSYICSRYYRAPELIFGSTEYTTAIDTWSTGCVFAELLLGAPLFPGDSGVDQLVEIIKVLGTPTKEDICEMNASYTDFKFPQIHAHDWATIFRSRTPSRAIDCVSAFLVYTPSRRVHPLHVLSHAFFEPLRDPSAKLDNGRALPQLFDFTALELATCPQLNSLRVLQSCCSDYQPPEQAVDFAARATRDDSVIKSGLQTSEN